MSLIIPTSYSPLKSFGDSTTTEGAPLSKYVLAQLRSDASLDWVGELRALLVKDELKYRDFKEARPRLKQNRKLWKLIENGIGQASIIVIDPTPVYDWVEKVLKNSGAEKGVDYDDKKIIDDCGTALIGITPVAYLPLRISELVPGSRVIEVASLETYLPEKMKQQLGGGLKDAKVFAARSYAVFDLKSVDALDEGGSDEFNLSQKAILVQELASTIRIFDKEHPKSAELLNSAITYITEGIAENYPLWQAEKPDIFVKEYDSRTISEIQAADISAGWAREILDAANPAALCTMFERVWYNGTKIK
jgi:hypothetical protein